MIGNYKRFDMEKPPKRQPFYLKIVIWAICFPIAWLHRSKIDKSKVPKELKPPYFLLCNHNTFLDFIVMTKAIYPYGANYIVAMDGFLKIEWILRAVGGICTRKFSRNLSVVKNMFHARNNGDIIVMFPEARYSLCGTPAVLPDSLGKIIRKLDIPVVVLNMHGHHINSPFWHYGKRCYKPVEAEMKLLFSKEDIKNLSVDEINEKLAKSIVYDDFTWQKQKGIAVKNRNRAEGLHKILYQCPACLVEYQMDSKGHRLYCNACNKVWKMTTFGELKAINGETEFPYIPDWYEWERCNVKKEVEAGTYSFESDVRVESLPNSKGFIKLPGPATLVHNMEGFKLNGVSNTGPFEQVWKVPALYSCHIEFNYKGKGEDVVDLNTNNDTLYIYPQRKDFSVTKISLATEELYKDYVRKNRRKDLRNTHS